MEIKFEPRDLWIGLYWKSKPSPDHYHQDDCTKITCYLCIIPMFPIIWSFEI